MTKKVLQEPMVNYQGRMVPKNNFRVFIYEVNGKKRVVNSFEEYEAYLNTGKWFSMQSEAIDVKKLQDEKEKLKAVQEDLKELSEEKAESVEKRAYKKKNTI